MVALPNCFQRTNAFDEGMAPALHPQMAGLPKSGSAWHELSSNLVPAPTISTTSVNMRGERFELLFCHLGNGMNRSLHIPHKV